MKDAVRRDRYGLGALGIYLALSILFFGRGVVGHFNNAWVGQHQGDPGAFMWFFTWLAHALDSWKNPTFSDAIWAPAGISLIWTTWMPLAGFLAWPITRTLGPVAAYNAVTLPLIPLAAWSMFLLSRYVTDSWWPSFFGGYLFGFCGYMTFYLWVGDPILLAVFPVPLVILIALQALRARISPWRFTAYLAGLLVAIFLISPEIFASSTMFAAVTFGVAIAVYDPETRKQLRALIWPILASYLIALVVLSPYLYCFWSIPAPKAPIWQTFLSSADLLFFLLPSHVSELGRISGVRRFLDSVPTTIFVGYTYLGPILLSIVVAFLWNNRREPTAKLLLVTMIVIAVAAMGPELIVDGRRVALMPGALLTALPLIRAAVAVRFVIYLALAASLTVAMWLSTSRTALYAKCAVMAMAIAFTMPSLSTAQWNSSDTTPAFFLDGAYRRYLRPGENIIIVPYGWTGNCMIWQAHTDMYFHMAEAWAGMPPHEFERWPAMVALYNGNYLPEPELQLKAFLAAHDVTAVVVEERSKTSDDAKQRQDYDTVIAALGSTPEKVGGVLIYRLAPSDLAAWRNLRPLDLERRVDEARLGALLGAIERYLQSGAELSQISMPRLEEAGLIRGDWVGGPDIRISKAFWLKAIARGKIEAGIFGSHSVIAALATKYQRDALGVRVIPIPGRSANRDEELALLLLTYDRSSVALAAEHAGSATDVNAVPFTVAPAASARVR